MINNGTLFIGTLANYFIIMNLREHFKHFLHNKELKHKLYIIIFESDTPAGKLFDVALIICITLSILLAILESLQGLPSYLTLPFIIL